MATFLAILSWIGANWAALIAGIAGVLTALVGIFMLIPGDQPEKTLQKIVDFLANFSRKPKE